jgi:hypothetical protein
MNNNLSDVEQRVKRYWYIDGIGELMGGGMFLLLGLYFSAQQYFGDQSLVGVILQSGFAVILIGGVFVARRLVNLLKTRLTYPRTGYVEYPTTEKNATWRRIFAAAIAMAVAMFSIVITRRIDAIDSMVAVTGVLVAVILLVKQGWSSGVSRFYILSAASLVLGIVLSVSGLPRGYNLGTFYGLMGTAFAISGGLTLRRYLQENPAPVEPQNE